MFRIRNLRATLDRWTTANPVLMDGEIGVERNDGETTSKLRIGNNVNNFLDLDPYIPKTQVADLAQNYAGGQVATAAEVVPSLSFRQRVSAVDVLLNYMRGAPGEDWRRIDGAMVVPEKWSKASDPSYLPKQLDAFYLRVAAYAQARSTKVGTPTLKGLASGTQSMLAELMFVNSQEWHFGQTGLYTAIGFNFKRPMFMIRNGLAMRGQYDTRLVAHDLGTGVGNMFATSYRCFDETPIRANGSAVPWGTTANEVKAYQSSGMGQVAAGSGVAPFVSWRYAKTPRAVITADVFREMSTVSVDNVDGIDRAWFSANGVAIPSDLTNNALRVGDWVFWTQGQNPIDAHERAWIEFVQVVAINNTTTPGFTAVGAGTITLSRPASVDCIIAQDFWSFPIKYPRAFHQQTAANGGIENVEAHSLTKIDLSLWCRSLYFGGFEMVTDPAVNTTPTSFLSVCGTPSGAALVEDIGCWNPGVQGLDFNTCIDPTIRNIRLFGSNNASAQGLLIDAGITRGMHIIGMRAEGFVSSVIQAESSSDVVIEKAVIVNDHPANSGGSIFLVNESSIVVRDLTWIASQGGSLVGRGSGTDSTARFSAEGDIRIIAPSKTKRPSFKMSDFSSQARIRYEGWDFAGTGLRKTSLSPVKNIVKIVLPFAKASTTTVTPLAALPMGIIRNAHITLPANSTGLKGLELRNGISLSAVLLGRRATHATNSATDSVGDGVGSVADRTIVSSTGEFIAISVDDLVVWRGSNPGGSDFITKVTDISNIPNSMVVADLLPAPLVSGQTITIGDNAVPGQTVRIASTAYGFGPITGRSSFNMGKLDAEVAGTPSYLAATFDTTTTDLSGDIVLELEMYPLSVPLGGTVSNNTDGYGPIKPVLTGDRQGSSFSASALSALRGLGIASDATVDSGKAKGWDLDGLVQPFLDKEAIGAVTPATGSIYFVQFRASQSKALANLWAQASKAGVLGSATCTYFRAAFYQINAAGDTFVESGSSASDPAQFTATTRIGFPMTTPGQVNAGALCLMAVLVTWTGTPTTVMQFCGIPMTTGMAGMYQQLGITGFRRFGVAGTLQTTLPSSIPVASLAAGGTGAVWLGGS